MSTRAFSKQSTTPGEKIKKPIHFSKVNATSTTSSGKRLSRSWAWRQPRESTWTKGLWPTQESWSQDGPPKITLCSRSIRLNWETSIQMPSLDTSTPEIRTTSLSKRCSPMSSTHIESTKWEGLQRRPGMTTRSSRLQIWLRRQTSSSTRSMWVISIRSPPSTHSKCQL